MQVGKRYPQQHHFTMVFTNNTSESLDSIGKSCNYPKPSKVFTIKKISSTSVSLKTKCFTGKN